MKKRTIILTIVLFTVGFLGASFAAPQWAIKADYAESCSCNPTCPCLFGSPSTLGKCEGNNLIEIKAGHYRGVRLDGVSVVSAFSLGKWLKVYVNEGATDEQVTAVLELLKQKETFGIIYGGNTEILTVEKAPISVARTATTVTFSVPDSTVEIEMMKGKGGQPIRIQNLPVPFVNDHTQYKSVVNTHTSDGRTFKYSGTNGLTSTINVSG